MYSHMKDNPLIVSIKIQYVFYNIKDNNSYCNVSTENSIKFIFIKGMNDI